MMRTDIKHRVQPKVMIRTKLVEYYSNESREHGIQQQYNLGWRVKSSTQLDISKFQILYFR